MLLAACSTTAESDRASVTVPAKDGRVLDAAKAQAAGGSTNADEYKGALMAMYFIVENIRALGETCPRLHEYGSGFREGVDAWMARNSSVIGELRERQVDLLQQEIGRRQPAEDMVRQWSAGITAEHRAMDDTRLRTDCAPYASVLGDPRSDLEVGAAAQLALIRSHARAAPDVE